RLYQVEYAMEAISHAGTALGVLARDGVVLAAEKKTASKLLDTGSGLVGEEKIYKDYKDDISLAEAVSLAVKVLAKTMDSATITSEKIEFATLGLDKSGQVQIHTYTPAEIDELLKKEGVNTAPAEGVAGAGSA
ncbi:hypothetical protein HDU93_005287, partial [Gonapodya sp. JEL0774]